MANRFFPSESVGSIMSANVPVYGPEDEVQQILNYLSSSGPWDIMHYVYVVGDGKKLLGSLGISRLLQSSMSATAKSIMGHVPASLSPNDDREQSIFAAIKYDLDSIPVVEKGVFMGVIGPKSIIDIMHAEHLEDGLLSAGVRGGKNGKHLAKLATGGLRHVLIARAPWLLFGAVVGLGLGLISSFFEAALEKSIALAYFVPVVAYIADSVGTQSEAIVVRALATLKISYVGYLVREALIGLSLGMLLGIIGGVGAAVIGNSADIGLTVGLSLLTASTVATILAASIPICFKALGKDPALGSGPLSTALQDVISVVVYFLFAMWLVG